MCSMPIRGGCLGKIPPPKIAHPLLARPLWGLPILGMGVQTGLWRVGPIPKLRCPHYFAWLPCGGSDGQSWAWGWNFITRLCCGSIDERLTELQSLPDAPGTDDTTDKIYQLLHLGYSRDKLVCAIELMKQCPFSTRGVEQAHDYCSMFSRIHPAAGIDHIAARGLLHAARVLIQNPHTEALARSIEKLKAKIHRLESKSGVGRTGRQLFLSEMMPGVIERRVCPQARKAGAQQSFAIHSGMWGQLTDQEKQAYEEAARDKREAFFVELREKVLELHNEVKGKEVALAALKRGEGSSPVTMSGTRLTEEDMQSMAGMRDGAEFQKAALLQLRKDALALQPMVPDHEKDFLMNIDVNLGQGDPWLCDWMKRIGFLRDYFRGHVLVVDMGTIGERSYFFSFALQRPYVTAFQRLNKLPAVMPLVRDLEARSFYEMMHAIDDIWPWQFELKLAPPAYGWEFIDVEKDRVWVLQHCDVVGGTIASPSHPAPRAPFPSGR